MNERARIVNFVNHTEAPLRVYMTVTDDGSVVVHLKPGVNYEVPLNGSDCNLLPGQFIDFVIDDLGKIAPSEAKHITEAGG